MANSNGFDDLEYLSPDFDLNTLTVPRLRAILVSHDVSYPASAKKAQLIRILQDEVLPKAKKLLRERELVRRTSEGIMDMSSRETSVVSDRDEGEREVAAERDRESMPPPPTPSTTSTAAGVRRGRSRQTVRGSTATDSEDGNALPTPSTLSRRRTGRSTASKHPRASDTETGEDGVATPRAVDATPRRASPRKLRKNEALPSVEVEQSPAFPVKTEARDESVFTDDNPFQSGRSPSTWGHRPRSASPRKSSSLRLSESTAATDEQLKRTSETPVKIKQEDDVNVPTRSPFDFPVSKPKTPKVEESEDEVLSAGEEFTPEEQLALEQEAAAREQLHAARRRRPRKQGFASRAAPWVVILSLFGGFGAWWRKEKMEIGYCGVGKSNWSLAETRVPDWAKVLEPHCEPCPAHAFCYPNLETKCEHDFLLKPHPLSLGGLIPLPPTCEPDSEKTRRVKAVADKAVEELRDRRAKWECGELQEDGKGPKPAEVPEPELKQEVAKKRRRKMSDAEFDDLWKGAIGEIIGRDEVVSETKGPSQVLTLTSTSLAGLPFTCAVRRHLRLSLLAYRLPLSILTVVIIALAYARSRVLARRSDMARVPELVATTLDRLATQAALYARGEAMEPWIAVGQLRDDVLRTELRGSRREELWKRVRSVVEGNANVRAAVREGRGGDVARVWEWIGGVSSVGADLEGPARRESGKVRFSTSPGGEAHSPRGDAEGDASVAKGPRRESKKWEEGRPIY